MDTELALDREPRALREINFLIQSRDGERRDREVFEGK